MKLKLLRNLFLFLSIVVLSFGIGYRQGKKASLSPASLFSTNSADNSKVQDLTNADFSLFWDVWNRLSRSYIFKKDMVPQKMVYGAISGMVASLGDPYTVFLAPDQNKEAKDNLGGLFEGIGAQLGIKDKKIVVISPLKSSPAEKAGLKPGDWIVKVNNEETINWTLPQAVSKIRGPKGTSLSLTILHPEASKTAEISLKRDTIQVASVEWEMKNAKCRDIEKADCGIEIIKGDCSDCRKVVYLRLGQFGDNSSDEWNKAVTEVVKEIGKTGAGNIKGIVLDLRNNPGGYLSGSVYIASEFLADGTVFTQENADGRRQKFEVNRKGKLLSIPMTVLINKGSASASEIVAGTLQERGRAKIFGESSFGKGSIQEVQELAQGAGVHITIAKWLLPSEKWINGAGIKPDVEIMNDDAKPDQDLQLEKAVENLLK